MLPSEVQTPPKPPYTGKAPESAYETLRTIVLVLLAAIAIRAFVAQPFVVQGRSMEPSFHSQDYLIVDKLRYRVGEVKRGDVIVFKAPEDITQNYIKRVVGLPGETVKIENESVFIDGQQLLEPYLDDGLLSRSTTGSFLLETTLGEHEYFVLGDNRDHSSDSRRWGPLPDDNILGKAALNIFPFQDFGLIEAPAYDVE